MTQKVMQFLNRGTLLVLGILAGVVSAGTKFVAVAAEASVAPLWNGIAHACAGLCAIFFVGAVEGFRNTSRLGEIVSVLGLLMLIIGGIEIILYVF